MIQVCSSCGTRWNVRDRRRVWCPRCNGTLLAPGDHPAQPAAPAQGAEWGARPSAVAGRTPPRLPPGYRWIAVRPGAGPPPRRRPRHVGPTPRYAYIPRWGLHDHFEHLDAQEAPARSGPSTTMVRRALVVTMAALGAAALIHLIRYMLLIVNRSVLLDPWVAGIATWLGVAASVVALFTVVAAAIILTNWLIGRRAAAFAHRGHADPRSVWALRGGCLVPFVNLAWAPIFVIELAGVEERLHRLRRSIVAWWLVWVLSTAVSVFSMATSLASDAQGIANNTVVTTVAYLLALAALLLVYKVFQGFERRPVERPVKRWVMVSEKQGQPQQEPESGFENFAAVESEGQNPAA